MEYLPHILVVDDDRRLRSLLHDYLGQNGFWVSLAESTAVADQMLREIEFDCIILDVMMPDETGLEFIVRYRKHYNAPVLMLTALGEADNRIEGLEKGADDYLVKPFEPKELVLRIRNLVQRTAKPQGDVLRIGDMTFDKNTGQLSRNGELVYLTESELGLLVLLADKCGEAVSRDYLAEIMKTTARSVDVQIGRLRKKMGDDGKIPTLISTVRGEGYSLKTL